MRSRQSFWTAGTFLLCLSTICLAAATAIGSEPAVGPIDVSREVSKIDFVGNTVIPAEDLRRALADDLDFQFATHPACSLDDFLGLIQRRLMDGFHWNGFPLPKISVRQQYQAPRITVEIDAGRRYREGRLQVTGSEHIPAQALEQWFLKNRPKRDTCPVNFTIAGKSFTHWVNSSGSPTQPHGPLWLPGIFASYHLPDIAHYRNEVLRCCQGYGYFETKVDVELRSEEDGTATLLIAINDEGPEARLDNITLSGLERNQPEELIEFLGLQPGMPVTGTLRAELMRKLFESGKYLEHKVNFVETQKSHFDLRIDVCENESASPLGTPRSEREEAACRLAGWINRLSFAEEDLVIESTDEPKWRVVWSTRDQMLLAEYAGWTAAQGPNRYAAALLADPSGIEVSSPSGREKIFIPRVNKQVIVQLIGTARRPNDDEGRSKLLFGVGMSTVIAGQSPVAAVIMVPPAMLIKEFTEFNKSECRFEIQNGHAFFEADDLLLEMDYETGRLLELEFYDSPSIRISTRSNLLKSEIDQHRQMTQSFASAFDAAHPCASILRFCLRLVAPDILLAEFAVDDPDWEQKSWEQYFREGPRKRWDQSQPDLDEDIAAIEDMIDFVQRFLKPETFDPLDRIVVDMWKRTFHPDESDFHLPPENERGYYKWMGEAEKLAAQLGRDSWFYRVTHDWNLTINHQKRQETKVIQAQLVSDAETEKLGPVAAWYSSMIGWLMNYPPQDELTDAALKQLSLERVEHEIEELLRPEAALSQILEGLLRSAAECPRDDWNDMVELLVPEEFQPAVRKVGAACRRAKSNPLAAVTQIVEHLYPEMIAPALQQYFEPEETEQTEPAAANDGQ